MRAKPCKLFSVGQGPIPVMPKGKGIRKGSVVCLKPVVLPDLSGVKAGRVTDIEHHATTSTMYGESQKIVDGLISDYDKEQMFLSFEQKLARAVVKPKGLTTTPRPDSPFKRDKAQAVVVVKKKKTLVKL